MTIRDSKGPLDGAAGLARAADVAGGFGDDFDGDFAAFLPAAVAGRAERRLFFAVFLVALRVFADFRRPAVMP
ncbi:MAG: hypothetical protein AB7T86_12700 [Xanthobacteraceae bacterium]|uniref:hypothetical protein n=1 Tax=Pseudolabrys sp. TaxID=1960880 RepID=UPI003D130C69